MKKNLTIWIFQSGEPLHCDEGNPRPMRAMNLADKLVKNGHNVVLWSSSFYHQKKIQRSKYNKNYKVNDNLEIRLIKTFGYKRNIGLGRFIDHIGMGIKLFFLIKKEKKLPDVAFSGFPPIEAAYAIVNYLSKKNIPTMLDIKDQWPSIFIDRLPKFLKLFGRFIFSVYFWLTKKVIINATSISTITESSMDWALNFSGRSRSKNDRITPLTSKYTGINEAEIETARLWWNEKYDFKNRPCLFFVGTHSFTYDFYPVSDAIKLCNKNNININFVICGSGNANLSIKNILGNHSNVFFPGYIDLPKINTLAEKSIAALVNYKNTPDFLNSVPNKAIDAMALGLPILTPMNGEMGNLINNSGAGIKYENGHELYEALRLLIENKTIQNELSKNSLRIYHKNFEFNMVYDELVTHMENLESNA